MRAAARLAVFAAAALLGATTAFPQDPSKDLRSDDVKVRLAAVETLRASGGPGAEEALLEALKDKDWEVVEKAALALGEKGGDAAKKALTQFAVDAPVGRLRAAAAKSLARLGAADAAAEQIVSRAQGDRARNAYEAIAFLAAEVSSDALAKAVDRGLKSPVDLGARATAARGICAFPPDQRASRLQQLAFDPDVTIASAALEGARIRPDEALLSPLLAVLSAPKLPESVERRAMRAVVDVVAAKPSPEERTKVAGRVLDALRTAGSAESGARLARLAGDLAEAPSPIVPAEAVTEALLAVADHGDARVRAAVVRSLQRVGGDAAADRATDMAANDADARVRRLAVEAVAATRGPFHEGAFRLFADRLANDADPFVREEAAIALGRKGLKGAEMTLQRAVDRAISTKDGSEWAVGTCALVSLGKTEDPAAVRVLADTIARAKDWRLRASAVVGLGHVRQKEAVPHLIAALDAKEPAIRMSAFEFLRRMTGEEVAGKRAAWTAWWEKNGPAYVFTDPEAEAKKAQKYGYAPTPVGVYEGFDVIVLQSRGDHIEQMLEVLEVEHRLTRSGQLDDAGLHPLAVFVSNCTGEITSKDVEPLAWFVRSGGYLFGSCWALQETVEKIYPGAIRKLPYKGQVIDNVESSVCKPGSAFLADVMVPGCVPIYVLWGSHLIEVLDPDRVEVLIDSPWTEQKYGSGNMAAWFRAGHGLVLDSANHFDRQGFEQVIGLKDGEDRMAYAIDHMALSYAEVRKIPPKTWESGSKANKEVRDLSAFRFITNFVREKRKSSE